MPSMAMGPKFLRPLLSVLGPKFTSATRMLPAIGRLI